MHWSMALQVSPVSMPVALYSWQVSSGIPFS
jgi:hypothetical protein